MPTVRESGAAIKYVTSSGFSLMTRIYVLGPRPVNRLLHRTHRVRTVPLLSCTPCTRIKRPPCRCAYRVLVLPRSPWTPHKLAAPTVVVRIALLQRLDTRPLNVAITPLPGELIFDAVPSNRIKKNVSFFPSSGCEGKRKTKEGEIFENGFFFFFFLISRRGSNDNVERKKRRGDIIDFVFLKEVGEDRGQLSGRKLIVPVKVSGIR